MRLIISRLKCIRDRQRIHGKHKNNGERGNKLDNLNELVDNQSYGLSSTADTNNARSISQYTSNGWWSKPNCNMSNRQQGQQIAWRNKEYICMSQHSMGTNAMMNTNMNGFGFTQAQSGA